MIRVRLLFALLSLTVSATAQDRFVTAYCCTSVGIPPQSWFLSTASGCVPLGGASAIGSDATGSIVDFRGGAVNEVSRLSATGSRTPLFSTYEGGFAIAPLGNGDLLFLQYSGAPHGDLVFRVHSLDGTVKSTHGPVPFAFGSLGWPVSMDVAADQCTVAVATGAIRRYDICRNQVLASVPTTSTGAILDVRILPDGNYLASAWQKVFVVDSSGTILKQFPNVFLQGLDPSGTAFWTMAGTTTFRKIEIATGNTLDERPISCPGAGGYLIEVENGYRAAVDGAAAIPSASPLVLLMLAGTLGAIAWLRVR